MHPGKSWLAALPGGILSCLVACGGDAPSGPSTTVNLAPNTIPAGTRLTVVSGETGAPVPGARIVVAGRTQTADAGGVVSLTDPAEIASLVDVQAEGFFDRQTLLRTRETTRFALWPRTTSSGLSEAYTASLVYTSGSENPPPPGSTPLRRHRSSTMQVVVVPSEAIRADDRAHAAHFEAVAVLNAALGGRLTYVLAPERPAGGGVVFEARVDPADSDCQTRNIRAYTSYTLSSNQITGGRIVYCGADVARTSTTVHELGHSLGLHHSPDATEVMGPFFSRSRAGQFGARETLSLSLMYDRPAGNRFPDNDRDASATGVTTVTIACP